MGRRLTTVAAFDEPVRANLARNVLEEAGIAVIISDSEIVAMDWLLSNAVGGIKVQVWEEDAERAAAVLEAELGEAGGHATDAITEEELARQALAEEPEEEEIAREPPSDLVGERTVEVEDDEDPATGTTLRDGYAGPAFMAVLASLFIPLLLPYAIYLWYHAAFGAGRLTGRGQWAMTASGVILALILLLWLTLTTSILLFLLSPP